VIGAITAGLFSAGVTPATNSYESIASVSGTGSSGVITFSSIPATYTHLQVRAIGRSDWASDNVQLSMRLNGDSSTNYSTHNLIGTGSAASATGLSSVSYIEAGQVAGANLTGTAVGVTVIDILDYANVNKYKTTRALGGFDGNGVGQVIFVSGSWRSTAAVNSITLTAGAGSWTTTTRFALYGIKG
jgi:hypothetical protein